MTFDWTTFALQLVNVLILLAILRHLLFKPVAAMIAARQEASEAAMARAAEAEAKAKAAEARAAAEAEATATARHTALAAAQVEAEAARAKLIEAARTEAAQIVARGQAERERAAQAAEATALARARDLAGEIAARALAAQPQGPAGYAARLDAALAAMSPAERAALLAGGDLRLVSPAALAPGDLAAAEAALAHWGLAPRPLVDPALIAGLELRSGAGVIRNSLAHDLEQIAAALAKEGTDG